jgi:hypothetical protein
MGDGVFCAVHADIIWQEPSDEVGSGDLFAALSQLQDSCQRART